MQDTEASTNAANAARRADAFRRVAEGSLHDAYRLAGAILRDPSEARDAVHDAFITGWQKWPSLRDPTRFDSWFKRIIVNVCRERLRQASRRRSSDLDSQAGLAVPDRSREVHDRLLVEHGLARLKPDDRIVLALRYYQDLKVDDIASVLDIPPGTVKSRLNRAHARLRDVIESSMPNEDARR